MAGERARDDELAATVEALVADADVEVEWLTPWRGFLPVVGQQDGEFPRAQPEA